MTEQTRIYLDNNATTRPFPEVIEAMSRHFADSFANPGSRHSEGRIARKALENARESLANILGADPREVVLTSGGTEATNMAIFGLTGRQKPGIIALTAGEHPATMESCRQLEQSGWRLLRMDVDSSGRLIAERLSTLPWDEIKLATIILAHNETGVVQDVVPLAELCSKHNVPLHLDAVQMVGKLPVNFHELGAATLSLGAHKFYGPRGIGALLLRQRVELAPTLFGGHQEAGRRPGTEPVALAVGMAKALEIWKSRSERLTPAIAALRDRLQQGLAARCPPVVVNGKDAPRLPNTLNIAFPGLDGEAMLVALDLEGIACSLGSTCASGSAEPAPALIAMGCSMEVCRSSVRFSLGVDTTSAEIDDAIERISRVVARQRSVSE